MAPRNRISQLLEEARRLALTGQDEPATQRYVEILRHNPTHLAALNELGTLAYRGGHRSAARTAYEQAVRHHPHDAAVRVNLANVLYDDEDLAAARTHYETVLAETPGFEEAHQGLARIFADLGEAEAAADHRRKGYSGHAVSVQPYRGAKPPVSVLMLVSTGDGNIPLHHILDDRTFAVTVLHPEFFDAGAPLPPHDIVFNAIGDADLCGNALAAAEQVVARTKAPVVNPPARVLETGRAANATRFGNIHGVTAPRIRSLQRTALLQADNLTFPLLIRTPGFQTGLNFSFVERSEDLAATMDTLPGDELLAISYLDARGADGMARKYRVMIIDGRLYPLHLAISKNWKVHYFTSDMAATEAYREEEKKFLANAPAVLGERAIAAIRKIGERMKLDYAGIDFAVGRDGSVLFFEANATMVMIPPAANPIWDYRRIPIENAIKAAQQMLLTRTGKADRLP